MNDIKTIFEHLINDADNEALRRQMNEAWRSVIKNHVLANTDREAYGLVTLTAWSTNAEGRRCFLTGRALGDAGYYWETSFANDSLCEMHSHRHIEILYVVEGKLKIRIADKDVAVREGEQLLINAGVIHGEYLNTEDCLLLCLGLDDSYFAQESDMHTALGGLIARKKSDYMYMRFTPLANADETRQAYATLLEEVPRNRSGKKNIMIGYAERIVDLLRIEFQVQVTKEMKDDFRQALVEDISLYIKEHYASVNVLQIGQEYHYTPDYLSRLFRKQKGKSLSLYIQDIRLKEAAKLLEGTNIPVDEIAHRVGYHNLGFFYQLFKKKYGRMPAEYKKSLF